MADLWLFPPAAVVGYLFGSIPAGLIVSRLTKGIDIRDYGSGKTGFTNVLRTLGLKAAVIVLVIDLAKGALPIVLARLISDEPYVQTVAGLSVVIGHDWPVFASFRGGRGVTAAFGVLLGMSPIVALILWPIGISVALISRYMSLMSILGSLLTVAVLVVLAILGWEPWAYAVYAALSGTLIFILHIENLKRLLAGTEPKLGRGGEQRGQPLQKTS